jgi:hypothetical protein
MKTKKIWSWSQLAITNISGAASIFIRKRRKKLCPKKTILMSVSTDSFFVWLYQTFDLVFSKSRKWLFQPSIIAPAFLTLDPGQDIVSNLCFGKPGKNLSKHVPKNGRWEGGGKLALVGETMTPATTIQCRHPSYRHPSYRQTKCRDCKKPNTDCRLAHLSTTQIFYTTQFFNITFIALALAAHCCVRW